MAHYPQPHSRTRAPRVRVPNNESVSFNLGGKQVSATLQRLSATGGLAEFPSAIGEVALAEAVFKTASGTINALVEFLSPSPKQPAVMPFRFVALDDDDYRRLTATLQAMRRQGLGE